MLVQSCIWRTDRRPRGRARAGERDCIPIRLKGFKGISILKVKSSLPPSPSASLSLSLSLSPTARTAPFKVWRVTERASERPHPIVGYLRGQRSLQEEDASEAKRSEARWDRSLFGQNRRRKAMAKCDKGAKWRPTDPWYKLARLIEESDGRG